MIRAGEVSQPSPGEPSERNLYFKAAQNFLCSVKAIKYFRRRKGEKSVIFHLTIVAASPAWGEADWSHQTSLEKSELQMSQEGLQSYRALSGLGAARP